VLVSLDVFHLIITSRARHWAFLTLSGHSPFLPWIRCLAVSPSRGRLGDNEYFRSPQPVKLCNLGGFGCCQYRGDEPG
jgi:hypothetical protein